MRLANMTAKCPASADRVLILSKIKEKSPVVSLEVDAIREMHKPGHVIYEIFLVELLWD
jgi:hypothetical protein